ncbi:MAG: thermonuclease family protein [Gammaproteobacteria bacterium]
MAPNSGSPQSQHSPRPLPAAWSKSPIRLSGIDAPERGQPFGTVSGAPLGKLVFGKEVRIDYDKRDRYGRSVGKVLIADDDANLKQVEAGLAWHYKAYDRIRSTARYTH